MSEVEFEGLDIGADDSAVDDAFAAAFARASGAETEGETEEATPVEETAAESGQTRDDLGRFAPQPSLDGDEEETETEETEAVEPEVDPEVAAYLAKYGNDPQKALAAAVELSKLQGRQGSELGDLRQELQQLRARIEAPTHITQPITAETVEALDNQALDNPQAALARAAQLDPSGQLVSRVMDVWFATNPREAAAFQTRIAVDSALEGVKAELAPAVERTAQEQEDAAFQQAWDLAKAEKPDIDEKADAITATLEKIPALGRALMSTTDVNERAQLLKSVYDLAAPAAPAAEVAAAAAAATAEESRATKIKARVATAKTTGSIPGARESNEPTEADRIRDGILGANSSDILSGWSNE